jgi:hypothetical protein
MLRDEADDADTEYVTTVYSRVLLSPYFDWGSLQLEIERAPFEYNVTPRNFHS